jgi:drug/metabolite transporter (DMT)-like permease
MWNEVFNERGFVLAVLGALGGAVRAVALKTTWREGLRVVVVGSVLAFGVGVLGPSLLKPWFGEFTPEAGATGLLTASAFLIGLMGVTLIERWIDSKEEKSDDSQK